MDPLVLDIKRRSDNNHEKFKFLTPKIPWDKKLVDYCLGSLYEEK
jgi:hypothetical protein